jgi:hypothetical protein
MIDPLSVEWKATQVDFTGVDIKMIQFDATIELKNGVTKQHVFDFTKYMIGWCNDRFALGTTPEEIQAGGFWNANVFYTGLHNVEITASGLETKPVSSEIYNILISMGPEYAMQFRLTWGLKV